MLPNGPLDGIPLWGIFILTGALVLVAVEGGFILGRRRHRRETGEQAGAVGTMVGSTLGLLGFMLAFAFSFSAQRIDARRSALTDEANALGASYLRADMMPEPHRSEIRRLLREDVDAQIAGVEILRTAHSIARVDSIHTELWRHTAVLGREYPSPVTALFIQSLNNAIESYAKRLMTVRTRILAPVWLVLYVLTFVAMFAMGYQVALTGTTRSPAVVLVAFSFALVLCLVADLDRPHEGHLRLSQQPMYDVQAVMQADSR
jgi:hypothetical protein